MDFERAYQNFLDGTATNEEIEFVRQEMAKAKEINSIIDNVNDGDKIAKAEQDEVKKAVRKFKIKDTIKIFVIAIVSLVVVAGITLASILIPAYNNANDNVNYSAKEAKQKAIDKVIEYVLAENPNANTDKIRIIEFEKEFEYSGSAKRAHYVYVIEVYDGVDTVYEIEVNAKTGNLIVERD